MNSKDVAIGKVAYFIYYCPSPKFPGGEFNLSNYEVLKGTVAEQKDNSIVMETEEYGLLELKNTPLFKDYDEADNYRKHLTFI
ncbi:hypothetical protein JCM14036_15400 [Desulfotomaculum defluvii]